MTRPSLKSRFGEQIRAFVGYKNSLGFPYNESIRILGRFDDFCVERFPEKIVWIVNSHLHGWRNEIRKHSRPPKSYYGHTGVCKVSSGCWNRSIYDSHIHDQQRPRVCSTSLQ